LFLACKIVFSNIILLRILVFVNIIFKVYLVFVDIIHIRMSEKC
jgi:hypothetical protein